MKAIRTGNFRWAIGGLCLVIGAMMLVVPHQFSSPVYAALRPHLTLWGGAFLAAGFALIALAALPSPRWVGAAVHLLVALAFLTLAYGFVGVGGWTGTSNWAAVGLASALVPLLPRSVGRAPRHEAADLLPLTLGSGAALTGLAILAAPGQFASPIYDVIRPYLPVFGAAFLLGGLSLAGVQFLPAVPSAARWTAYFLAGAVLLAFFAASAVPLRAWIGIAYYGGMGLLLWLLPWIERRFEGLDPSSLEVRLALSLSSALVISDVLLIAVMDDMVMARFSPGSVSGVAEAREISFAVLVASAVAAAAIGIAAARWLAAPLRAISRASERLAAEDLSAPLPRSTVTEVVGLAHAFGEMRDRLAARTAERERLLEEMRHRAAELDAANKELEAFAYSVSHDLRAPLRSIDGFSLALLEDSSDHLDDLGKEHLRWVRSETVRMGQLIDDLLSLSRVTRAEMRRERLDLGALARSVAEGLRRGDRERQVEIAIAPELSAHGDQHLLRIALENLMGNAWKFTSAHPRGRIEFGCERRGEEKIFFVRDDGAGFDMAYADKLFGPFQRLHDQEEFPGTGIGLAIVQRIVHRHGGRIWAEGAVEKGATFYFTLRQ